MVIYDNAYIYDKPQLKKLNEALDSITDEEFERKVFEIECKCNGLDPEHPEHPEHPESPKRLKKIRRRYKWKYEIWPIIRNTFSWIFMIYCVFDAGRNFANDLPWWAVIIPLLGGLGWFNIFLTYKFGSDYIYFKK